MKLFNIVVALMSIIIFMIEPNVGIMISLMTALYLIVFYSLKSADLNRNSPYPNHLAYSSVNYGIRIPEWKDNMELQYSKSERDEDIKYLLGKRSAQAAKARDVELTEDEQEAWDNLIRKI